ncbi:hypothetical protein ACFY1J_36990 [Streptomyces sp. NPDC001406]|jgi:hypothetical protein
MTEDMNATVRGAEAAGATEMLGTTPDGSCATSSTRSPAWSRAGPTG